MDLIKMNTTKYNNKEGLVLLVLQDARDKTDYFKTYIPREKVIYKEVSFIHCKLHFKIAFQNSLTIKERHG